MMNSKDPKIAKIINDCSENAKKTTNSCYFPGCKNKSINSHILQKNGILSSIATDNHLWRYQVNHFDDDLFIFRKVGINKIYTLLGFCNTHDTDLFKKIETNTIDFNDYESCLQFLLRTVYNEVWLKEVVIKMLTYIKDNNDVPSDNNFLDANIDQNKIGLEDLKFLEDEIWKDINKKSENFVFHWREMEFQEFCMNGIYTYDTSEEREKYIISHGKDMDRLSEIFITFFPYNGKSILIMGYHKNDEQKVKGYVMTFIKEAEKRTLRKLTNHALFHCETWVCSENFYKTNFEGIEDIFPKLTDYSITSIINERIVFDLNMFNKSFRTKLLMWKKQYIG
ncbi:hypothetical protein [Chryseobacterium binzhouense]|uniref:hypothetical protein n=1 Tax=Chryseobacterium binzhouense TaxID=2593646 RepID=UPI00289F6770|nr:hypothetical protein [Chryseobacterium binzhouense]